MRAREARKPKPKLDLQESGERLRGVVEAVYVEKGFGFIAGKDGIKRFFHTTACRSPLSTIRPADTVSYVHTEGPKGPRAENVRPV